MNDGLATLNQSILQYLCQCHATGDRQSLRQLGLDDRIINQLGDMTVGEIMHMARIKFTLAEISIDSNMLANMLERVRDQKYSQDLLTRLIEQGAPLSLVNELTGVTGIEFAALRRQLNIRQLGRTPSPSDEEMNRIFTAWREFDLRTNLDAEEWLALAMKTGLQIKSIYKVIVEDSPGEVRHVQRQQ